MADKFHQFQTKVHNEIQTLAKHVPKLWAIEAHYLCWTVKNVILSYHLTKEEAESKKPKDYYVFYGSGEDSATYSVIEVNTENVPIQTLMQLFFKTSM